MTTDKLTKCGLLVRSIIVHWESFNILADVPYEFFSQCHSMFLICQAGQWQQARFLHHQGPQCSSDHDTFHRSVFAPVCFSFKLCWHLPQISSFISETKLNFKLTANVQCISYNVYLRLWLHEKQNTCKNLAKMFQCFILHVTTTKNVLRWKHMQKCCKTFMQMF